MADNADSLANVATWTLTKLSSGSNNQYGGTFSIYMDYVAINGTSYYAFAIQNYESDAFDVPDGRYYLFLISNIDAPSTFINLYKSTYNGEPTFGSLYMYKGNGYIAEISNSSAIWNLRQIKKFPTATGELSFATTLQAESLSATFLSGAEDDAYNTSFAYEGTNILVQREKEVQMAVNEFGKGRSVYISGLPYSFENSRILQS